MPMQRLFLGVTVLALAMIGVAYAQDKSDDPNPKVRGQLPAFYKKLGLRDDQVQQVYKIRAGYKVKVDDLKRQMEKLRAAEKSELEKVLTAEQLKRLKELRSGEKTTEKPKEPEKTKPK
jgi:hypothetical protein